MGYKGAIKARRGDKGQNGLKGAIRARKGYKVHKEAKYKGHKGLKRQ